MRWDKSRWLGTIGALALCLALAAPLAGAAETTREEYIARVEPICKTNVEANSRIFKGAKAEVKAGELKKGSKHFFRAATALAKTIRQIEAVPLPAADAAKLTRWIGLLGSEQRYFHKIGAALAAGDKYKAQNLSVKLNRNSNLANNAILALDFKHCRIDPSKFS
ncbi:MAG: hypothetical protein WA862_08935 [Solirubrobacterales bacterium]